MNGYYLLFIHFTVCIIKAKAFLADPSAFMQAAPAQEEEKVEDTPAEEKEESEEESDEDMGFGLFD